LVDQQNRVEIKGVTARDVRWLERSRRHQRREGKQGGKGWGRTRRRRPAS